MYFKHGTHILKPYEQCIAKPEIRTKSFNKIAFLVQSSYVDTACKVLETLKQNLGETEMKREKKINFLKNVHINHTAHLQQPHIVARNPEYFDIVSSHTLLIHSAVWSMTIR